MKEAILHTKDLAVGYGGQTLLKDIELAVRPGEVLTLIGPNGAGKSTVLRTLTRQLAPVAGTVFLGGRPMEAMSENDVARGMSLVMTERVRGEWMTCGDVVSSGRYPYTGRLGILSEHDREKVAEAMELVRVSDLRERDFSRVSDGQRQRVMLARAICQEPDVLVMDEPTSFLDIRYKFELLTVLRRLVSEKRLAVIMSLHELELAEKISDTVLCIKAGAVDRAGAPAEIFTDAYIEELYDLPRGSYGEFFWRAGRGTAGESHSFFQNKACQSFPCHEGVPEEEFNCLFCYCPLYTLGRRCGGNFTYTASGTKSCKNCNFPHARERYGAVLARFPELSALARETENGDGV